MSYAEVTPFSPPEQIGPDLYVVYGSVRINPLLCFSRNMAIVRDGDALTLINTVRMDDEGLAALESLGKVKHVLRLGSLHGLDDTFYVDRYETSFWGFPGGTTYSEPAVQEPLTEDGPLPFSGARLFEFRNIAQPEGVLLLERGPGILLTVDAVQSYATPPYKPHTSLFARVVSQLRGFPNETIVGPVWTQMMTDDRPALRREFERLLEWDFDQLLSAHGTFLPAGARAAVTAAVDARFGAG